MIPHTKRQRITTRTGAALERSYVFMHAASWEALHRLCESQRLSGSQVIEQLISIADSGNHKDTHAKALSSNA
jgi:DNA polymerase III delta subunit